MRYNFIVVALMLSATVQAQSDSVRTEYHTEDESISKSEIKRFIRYITRANVEEKTLVKVGFWPDVDRSPAFENETRTLQVGTELDISIEHKLTPSVSVFAGVSGHFNYETYAKFPLNIPIGTTIDPRLYDQPERMTRTAFSGKVGVRYYYEMADHIRRGLSANNLSGNYVMAQVAEPFIGFNAYRYYNQLTQEKFNYRYRTNLLVNPQPRVFVAYGIQRRLGRRGYFDINAGPEILFTDGFGTRDSFQLNALIGVGW
ncbi:hypothetical protein [Spirosoma arcticum]